jgi:hypothetical protein
MVGWEANPWGLSFVQVRVNGYLDNIIHFLMDYLDLGVVFVGTIGQS